MIVFVTGGTGFLGRHLTERLIQQGHQVRVLSTSREDAIAIEPLGPQIIIGDLRDRSTLLRLADGTELGFHLAGSVNLWGAFRDLYAVNVTGTQNILDTARDAGVRRFVFVSAAAIVSDGRPVIDANELVPVPAKPMGAYAQTKAIAERIVLDANSSSFETVAIRPPLLWGCGDRQFLPGLVRMIQAGRFVWIDGGRHLMSTCHVLNACAVIMAAAERARGGEAYFVTDGPAVQFREFATSLLAVVGVVPGIRSMSRRNAMWLADITSIVRFVVPGAFRDIPTREVVSLFGQQFTVNCSKARRDLGYEPAIDIASGIAKYGPQSTPIPRLQ